MAAGAVTILFLRPRRLNRMMSEVPGSGLAKRIAINEEPSLPPLWSPPKASKAFIPILALGQIIHAWILMAAIQRKRLVKGAILAIFIVLIVLISRYGPQPFNPTGPAWQELENVGEFYSSKKRLRRLLVSFGPYSAAVFTLLQALQVVIAPIPGELTGVLEDIFTETRSGFSFRHSGSRWALGWPLSLLTVWGGRS